MPVYTVGYFVEEVFLGQCRPRPPVAVLARCGTYVRRLACPGLGPLGENIYDAGGCFLADIPATVFARAALQLEVVDGRGRLLGSCALRLAKVQDCSEPLRHCSLLELPLRGASMASGAAVLRLGAFCLAPGDPAPPASWRLQPLLRLEESFEQLNDALQPDGLPSMGELEPSEAAKLIKKPTVPSKWVRARLEFAAIGYWDLALPGLQTGKPPRLSFRLEASGAAEDELVLLGAPEPIAQGKMLSWKTRRGLCFEVLRLYSAEVELPAERETAQLTVALLPPEGEGEEELAEARLPLGYHWPWIPETFSMVELLPMFAKDVPEHLRDGLAPFEAKHFPDEDWRHAALLAPGAAADARLNVPGAAVDAFGVPSSLGTLKCAYHLVKVTDSSQDESKEEEKDRGDKPDHHPSAATATAITKPRGDDAGHLASTAARHTHDAGYAKWQRFDAEAALAEVGDAKPGKRPSDATPTRRQGGGERQLHTAKSLLKKMEEENEGSRPDLDEFFTGARLREIFEASRGQAMTLELYVHRGLVLLPKGGCSLSGGTLALDEEPLQTYLEVYLGEKLVASLHESPADGYTPAFYYYKVLPLRLPQHARLELCLRRRGEDGKAGPMLGSTVVDLQDRWHNEAQAREAKQRLPRECRALWPASPGPLRAAGSLQLWARLHDEKVGEPPEDLWPTEPRGQKVEVRAVLREVRQLGLPDTGGDVTAILGLNLPQQRALGQGQQPVPQCTDEHWNLRGKAATAEFQWRAVFSNVDDSNMQASLVLAVHDRRRGALLGFANLPLKDQFLATRRFGEGPPEPPREADVELHDLRGRFRGRARLVLVVLPQGLADQHPVQTGRAGGLAPADLAPAMLAAEELRRPCRGRQRRDVAAAVAAKRSRGISAVAVALLVSAALGVQWLSLPQGRPAPQGLCAPPRATPSHGPRRRARPAGRAA